MPTVRRTVLLDRDDVVAFDSINDSHMSVSIRRSTVLDDQVTGNWNVAASRVEPLKPGASFRDRVRTAVLCVDTWPAELWVQALLGDFDALPLSCEADAVTGNAIAHHVDTGPFPFWWTRGDERRVPPR